MNPVKRVEDYHSHNFNLPVNFLQSLQGLENKRPEIGPMEDTKKDSKAPGGACQ
jgi:hypothetical protein